MGEDGTATVFLVADTGGSGELVVGLSRLGNSAGADGSGLLATIQFTALSPGSSDFALTAARVNDPQAQTLPATFGVVQLFDTKGPLT